VTRRQRCIGLLLAGPAALLSIEAPTNPFLADSLWPCPHRNGAAQASTPWPGPDPSESLSVQTRRIVANGASPWLVTPPAYPDGSIAIWGATITHVYKLRLFRGQLDVMDLVPIDNDLLDHHWNLFALADGRVVLPDPRERQLRIYQDAVPGDAGSRIALSATLDLDPAVLGRPALLQVARDGRLVSFTDTGHLTATDVTTGPVASYHLSPWPNEGIGHNQFPVGEANDLYLVTDQRMVRVDWTGSAFIKRWEVPYDSAAGSGSGCGTTPTLIGGPGDPDHLVVIVDNHAPNNRLVAFWRDAIPNDWAGIPGHDRRVAAITALPYARTDGTTQGVENSPCAWGYDIVVSQWSGLRPPADAIPGVQLVRWNPGNNSMQVVWENNAVAINNVPTWSAGSGLIYGTGRRGGLYHLYAMRTDDGTLQLDLPLGPEEIYLDQGNQILLLPGRQLVYPSLRGVVHVRPTTMRELRVQVDPPHDGRPTLQSGQGSIPSLLLRPGSHVWSGLDPTSSSLIWWIPGDPG
jgi:hypothetical protein